MIKFGNKRKPMKILILILACSFINCKQTQHSTAPNSEKINIEIIKDSSVKKEQLNNESIVDSLPDCIKNLISSFKKEEVTNPARSIYSYIYKGKKVYYTSGPCCDNFSDLYNENCKLIGHPNGGFTGRGDGKFPDFKKMITNEKLIWKDKRK